MPGGSDPGKILNASSALSQRRVDPFSKKDWYDVKAPAMFNIRNIGKTLVTRTQGTSEYRGLAWESTCVTCSMWEMRMGLRQRAADKQFSLVTIMNLELKKKKKEGGM